MVQKPDWAGLEDAAAAQAVRAVRTVLAGHPDEHPYGVVFHGFYGDGQSITWPTVSVGTEESLQRVVAVYEQERPNPRWGPWDRLLRWSGADLEYAIEASNAETDWARRVERLAAASGSQPGWDAIYARYLRCFPAAARRARSEFINAGDVDARFVAVAIDEEWTLVPLSLTAEQLAEHFPDHEGAQT